MIESLSDLTDAVERACRSRYRGHMLLEDAIQEAHIEAWKKIKADHTFGYALNAALWRANDIIVGKSALGAPERTPGSGSRQVSQTSYDEFTSRMGYDLFVEPAAPERAAFVDDVLRVLEPVERFIVEAMMAGYNHTEIAAELDRSVGAIRKRMPKIREKLSPALEDLRA